MEKNDKIYIAGHRGMVGAAILRLLEKEGYENLIVRTHAELDLIDQRKVSDFFRKEKPEIVILAAARVGGIKANMTFPGDFLYENLMIQNNVIHEAAVNGAKQLCFLGSSCVYPRECPQPMKEEFLLTGPFEPTNEGYAVAKLAGYKMCELYSQQHGFKSVSLMPCNLYGPNDHFDLEKSHVMSALTKRFTDAIDEGKDEITLWGTGSAKREFMHVDDAAAATLFFMRKGFSSEFVNVGPGKDISIKELAEKIAGMTGFNGSICWDHSKPDGMPRKCLDTSKMKDFGFAPSIPLEDGIRQMIEIYRGLKKAGKN